MTSRRPLIMVFGLLAFAGLLLGATFSPVSGKWLRGFSGIPGIEDRIVDDAQSVLHGANIEGATVSASGRNLTVGATAALSDAVEADLARIDGVGDVTFDYGAANGDGTEAGGGDAQVVAAETSLTIAYRGDTVALSGSVANADGYSSLLRASERLVGGEAVESAIEVSGGEPDDFVQVSTVASILRRLGDWYESAELRLDSDTLTLTGDTLPGADLAEADQRITSLAESAGLAVAITDRGDAAGAAATDDAADAAGDEADVADDTADAAGDEADAADADPDSDGGGGEDGAAGASGSELAAEVITGFDLGMVRFEPGTATLTEEATIALDDVALELGDLPPVPIAIVGHTSTEGDPDVNLLLSTERARTVAEYLVSKGVPPTQLNARGVGGAQPIADNSTEEGRASNERIELVVVEGN